MLSNHREYTMTDPLAVTQIHQIAIHADDLSESKAFYTDILGARMIAEFNPPGIVFFDFQGVRLLIEKGASNGTLYFRVEDINVAVEQLQAKGIQIDIMPHVIFKDDDGLFGPIGYEESMAFFKDPAGNVLALASQTPSD